MKNVLPSKWPGVIKHGSVTDHISALYDVLPTLTDIAGIDKPEFASGTSFLPALIGEEQPQPEYLYWEFPGYGGQMAVRMGKWKALRKDMHKGNLEWELYDLESDPAETKDISSEHPEVIAEVEEVVAREHTVPDNENWRYEFYAPVAPDVTIRTIGCSGKLVLKRCITLSTTYRQRNFSKDYISTLQKIMNKIS